MTWWDYVRRTARDDDQTTIARKSKGTQSMVSRWKSSQPHPPNAAAFARAYDRPVLEAFVAAGFLTPEEADERPIARPSLDDVTDEELLRIVAARMKEGRRDAGNAEAQKSGEVVAGPWERQQAARRGTPEPTEAD